MRFEPEIRRIDIVFLGDFNPKIFSPAWFAANKLIGEHESQSAKPEIIHSDVASFIMPWFRLHVIRDRFAIFTEQEAYFTHLYDLVSNTFLLLEHTPIHSLGYNWSIHIPCESEDEWHEFGHYLAPQNPWNNIFENSGMQRLEVVEKYPPENKLEGKIRFRTEPSREIKYGVYFNINDHYEVSDKKTVMGCEKILTVFRDNWNKSKDMADAKVGLLINNFNERAK
jgi:hypothetical protein